MGIYNNVNLTAIYKWRPTKRDLRSSLYNGLAAVVAKHPILSAIPTESDPPQFTRLKQIDLNQVVTFVSHEGSLGTNSEEALAKVFENQHDEPFSSTSLLPFWRVCVLEDTKESSSFAICFVFHHALADTRSAIIFQEDLERALSNPVGSSEGNIVHPSEEDLLPSIESLYDFEVAPRFSQDPSTVEEPLPDIWSGSPQFLPVKTRCMIVSVQAKPLSSMRQQCKEQSTTITAALMAMLADSFFQVLPEDHSTLYGDCALSVRHKLQNTVTPRSIGCYIGAFREIYHRRKQESIWDDARRTGTTIKSVAQRRDMDIPVSDLWNVKDIPQWFMGKIGKRRWAAWELSNVGFVGERPEDLSKGSPNIEGMYFSQSASACSGVLKISAATGRDKSMRLVFSWQQGSVDDDLVADIADKVTAHLKSFD